MKNLASYGATSLDVHRQLPAHSRMRIYPGYPLFPGYPGNPQDLKILSRDICIPDTVQYILAAPIFIPYEAVLI